jgi:iron complex transport system substrate-binding protein
MAGFFILGKTRLLVITMLLAAIVVGGCRNETSQSSSPVGQRIVVDDLGNSVELPAEVTRAVSLAPNLTEIAFAVGAGDRVVGVTTFCNFPDQTKTIRKIGDTLKPNIETIVALRPQVVFVTTASQLEAFSNILQKQGIQVFVTNPVSLNGVYEGIAKIGEVFGEEENATVLIGKMKDRIGRLQQKDETGLSTVFVQIDSSLFTIGKTSFISDALSKLPFKLATNDIEDAYPKISKEHARTLKPDLIIITNSPGNEKPNAVFDDSPAVKDQRIYSVDADILSRPGPRIVEALETIAGFERRWKAGNETR